MHAACDSRYQINTKCPSRSAAMYIDALMPPPSQLSAFIQLHTPRKCDKPATSSHLSSLPSSPAATAAAVCRAADRLRAARPPAACALLQWSRQPPQLLLLMQPPRQRGHQTGCAVAGCTAASCRQGQRCRGGWVRFEQA